MVPHTTRFKRPGERSGRAPAATIAEADRVDRSNSAWCGRLEITALDRFQERFGNGMPGSEPPITTVSPFAHQCRGFA